jgi:uncharacterized integral membrane protein
VDARNLKLVVAAILVIVVFVLIVQNQEVVSTRALFWTLEMPHFVLLGVTFLFGTVAGFLVGRTNRAGKKG